MRQFLKPAEEPIHLPTALSHTERAEASDEEFCEEMEALTKRGIRASKRLIGFSVGLFALFCLSGMTSLIVSSFMYPSAGALIRVVAPLSPFLIPELSREAYAAVLKRTSIGRRTVELLQKVLCEIDGNPAPLVVPFLLRLVNHASLLDPKVVGTDTLRRFFTTTGSLLFRVSPSDATFFGKKDVAALGMNLRSFKMYPKSPLLLSPFAVVNALRHTGDAGSLRILRSMLKNPPPPHDAYRVLLHKAIEAAIPEIEARLAREETKQNLLRPSQMEDATTLLRPSQESAEPAEELLRPTERRD